MDPINIPIPHYPPFKLRSSLIDVDPLIWVNLQYQYIQLFKVLLLKSPPHLATKSQHQLSEFVKVYLHEHSNDPGFFSLGAINPQIVKNEKSLRCLVFAIIQHYSIVQLNLTSEHVWAFIKLYVRENVTLVRTIVDGTYILKFNNNKKLKNISSILPLQNHLIHLIRQHKFDYASDLETLSHLLGQSIKAKQVISKGTGGTTGGFNIIKKNNNNNPSTNSSSSTFLSQFVNSHWIELIQAEFNPDLKYDNLRSLMVVSLILLTVNKLKTLLHALDLDGFHKLAQDYSLFVMVATSEAFDQLVPGAKDLILSQISFGNAPGAVVDSSPEVDSYKLQIIQDMFGVDADVSQRLIASKPDLTVEEIVHQVLENPSILENLPPPSSTTAAKVPLPASDLARFQGGPTKILKREKKNTVQSQELKQRSLDVAMRLLYDSDEDEPDDTYDDQERTSGLDDGSNSGSGGNKVGGQAGGVSVEERYLFALYKKNGGGIFEKLERKSPTRAQIHAKTKWSHEQIEGWFRMLSQSSRRFKMFEDDYFFNRDDGSLDIGGAAKQHHQLYASSKDSVKNQQRRDGQRKASKANHNRKDRHMKKV
ncbi:uncharacterized protein KQ657_003007 [Scheffersomyces spartinae]|uniref:CUE domain-containing protein n=1 Tax=Scheffersomyces spartinae TaxID=45513 RepID=A0A9P7V5F5_9ASCO|nr:uncharacterized protein KQ657_003007 [Scheffersomyces spartinae]KAG7191612.1 hypothetical protein KQ657_003007 [Scheffersomyces spartinae]